MFIQPETVAAIILALAIVCPPGLSFVLVVSINRARRYPDSGRLRSALACILILIWLPLISIVPKLVYPLYQ